MSRFTSGFEMGPGGTTTLRSPDHCSARVFPSRKRTSSDRQLLSKNPAGGSLATAQGIKNFSTFKSRRNWEEFHLRLVANQKNSVNCPPAIRNREGPDRIAENPEIKPIGKLVSLSSTRYRASTCDLSTWWSTTSLMGKCHLRMGLALRCFQRLSLPHIATRRCRGRDNRNTRGASFPVLSY